MTVQAQLRYLRLHAAVSTLLLIVLIVAGFQRGAPSAFTTIDVQRINVVEPSGGIRLVISNKALSPPPIERGQPFGYQPGNRGGLIFYNDEGTENGGLIFGGARDASGSYQSVGSLTFDQYEQDQAVALQTIDFAGRRRAGLAINDYPAGVTSSQLDKRRKLAEAMKDSLAKAESLKVLDALGPRQRLYAGRGRDGAALLSLSDIMGRPRIRLRVDSAGAATIEFLNERGEVVRSLP